jgi:uncharacterized protein
MFIGIGRFEVFIPASESLKDKRRVIRSVTSTVRTKFNVAVAEVDYQDLWQRSALGASCVSESVSHCQKVLREVEKTIGRLIAGQGELIDTTIRVVALEDL